MLKTNFKKSTYPPTPPSPHPQVHHHAKSRGTLGRGLLSNIPEHRLVPVRLLPASHVYAREPAADDSVIVVFNSSPAEVWIVKTRSVSRLEKDG